MSPSPYTDAVAGLISQSHRQVFRAQAVVPNVGTITLLPVDGALRFDENVAPRAQLDATFVVPGDTTTVEALDPRNGARVECRAGYVLPGGAEDVALVGDLGMRTRTVRRPDNTMRLTAHSDEALVIDNGPVVAGSVTASTAPLAIQALLNQALEPDPGSVTISHPDNTATSVVDISDRWTALDDLADSIGADVFDNGLRQWSIVSRPVTASESVLILAIGAGGLLTESEAELGRNDWANTVQIIYRWRTAGGTDSQIVGTAVVSGGPYVPAAAGTRTITLRRETPTTQAKANAAAKAVLARMLSRSRSYTLSAPSAWWLRPGHTVTVQLPTGDQERHLVSAVAFSLRDHRMTVQTRLPDAASVIGE